MRVGYVRVSTAEQNPARQMELMKSLGVEKIYQEKCSGKNTDRPQFNEMLSFLREGDTLYVESFSRLSRSTRDLLSTVTTLSERGVILVSDKEKFDTGTPQGKFVLTVLPLSRSLSGKAFWRDSEKELKLPNLRGNIKGVSPFLPVSNSSRWQERGQMVRLHSKTQSGTQVCPLPPSSAGANSMKSAKEVVKVVKNQVLRVTFA